jgi:aspartyl-tRNA(Asn)/glutamyl-tRNA(Gln) amidotransferase subunit A
VGLKPTYGRVSRHGVVTLSWSQDHCGPLTRTVEDAALMLQAIAGHDPQDPTSSKAPVPDYCQALGEGIAGLRVGVPRHYFFARSPDVDSEVLDISERALEVLQGLGARLEEVSIPSLAYARSANMIIMLSEAYAYHERNLRTRPHEYGLLQRRFFRIGGLLGGADYVQAQRCRQVVKREFAEVLRRVDVLATPTMPRTAPAFEGYDPVGHNRGPSYTAPFNVTGLPAISVPAGFARNGLPVGLQVAGKPFDEATVLRVAHAYEQQTRWFTRRPPI